MAKSPRQKLPIERRDTHFRVHYLALERHIASVYRLRGFSVLRATGATHGLYPEYHINSGVPETARPAADRIRCGGRSQDLALILAMLFDDGALPAGHCVIDTAPPEEPIKTYKRVLQATLDPLHPDCIALKDRHRGNKTFRRQARTVDRSLLEWLKKNAEQR